MIIEVCSKNIDIVVAFINRSYGAFMHYSIIAKSTIVWVKFDNPNVVKRQRMENNILYDGAAHKQWMPIWIVKEFQVYWILKAQLHKTSSYPTNNCKNVSSQGLTMSSLPFKLKKDTSTWIGVHWWVKSVLFDNLFLMAPLIYPHLIAKMAHLANKVPWEVTSHKPKDFKANHIIVQSLNIVSFEAHFCGVFLLIGAWVWVTFICFQETRIINEQIQLMQ